MPRLSEPELGALFAALADPTRRAILERLSTGEATVSELAEPFPVSVQAVFASASMSSDFSPESSITIPPSVVP